MEQYELSSLPLANYTTAAANVVEKYQKLVSAISHVLEHTTTLNAALSICPALREYLPEETIKKVDAPNPKNKQERAIVLPECIDIISTHAVAHHLLRSP
jgi:hypothetical protein